MESEEDQAERGKKCRIEKVEGIDEGRTERGDARRGVIRGGG